MTMMIGPEILLSVQVMLSFLDKDLDSDHSELFAIQSE